MFLTSAFQLVPSFSFFLNSTPFWKGWLMKWTEMDTISLSSLMFALPTEFIFSLKQYKRYAKRRVYWTASWMSNCYFKICSNKLHVYLAYSGLQSQYDQPSSKFFFPEWTALMKLFLEAPPLRALRILPVEFPRATIWLNLLRLCSTLSGRPWIVALCSAAL